MKHALRKPRILCFFLMLMFAVPSALHAEENQDSAHLVILHTKDLHGRFLDHNNQNKNLAALMGAFFKKTKTDNKNVLILDTGNFSPDYQYAKIADSKTIASLMSEMDYDALNIGNHELEGGAIHLNEIIRASSTPLLSENIEFTAREDANPEIKDYVIKELNGLKVGIIGMIGNDYATTYVNGKDFRIMDPNDNDRLTKLVDKLKPDVDVIIILANSTIDNALKATESITGSNVVVLMGWGGGGLHKAARRSESDSGPLFLFTDSQYINKLDLDINNKEIKNYKLDSIKIATLEHEDEGITKETAALVAKRQNYYDQNLGIILNDIDARRKTINNKPSNIISLIAKPVRDKWKKIDCVVINAGAIYSYPNDIIKAGPMSLGKLAKLYPFINTVVISKLSGRDIKSMLERSSSTASFSPEPKLFPAHQLRAFLQTSGLEYTLDFSKDSQVLSGDDKEIMKEGDRVSNIVINGKPLELDKYYTVATNDYVFGGGDGYVQFRKAKDVVKTGIEIQDLMRDYIKNHSPVTLDPPDNIIFMNRTGQDWNAAGTAHN